MARLSALETQSILVLILVRLLIVDGGLDDLADSLGTPNRNIMNRV